MSAPVRFDRRSFAASEIADAKATSTIAVCLPARNEAATVGAIVASIRNELVERVPLVDELVVVDDHSTDTTATMAADAGATVVDAATTLADRGAGPGKGQALWKSLQVTSADIVIWCDADIIGFGHEFVVGLAGALVTRPEICFVKGTYGRPLVDGDGGGRVTELVARPILSALHPDAAMFGQPLSGEYGGRRSLLETLRFVDGYGVDIALLIDAIDACGLDRVGEVDLGERRHRNRPLADLGPQATAVLVAALTRAGVEVSVPVALHRPDQAAVAVQHRELPPRSAS